MYTDWGGRVRLSWRTDHDSASQQITSVHGFCFYKERLLVVKLTHRGWDFPGGHVEQDETPETAFRREAAEEGGVKGTCRLLGAVEVDHRENANWESGGPYPEIGYQLFYRMQITEVLPFRAAFESEQRAFVSPAEAARRHHNWLPIYDAILDKALNRK
ncbi:NUDIX domain-containing protein [Alteribacter lacisalsi]|nr:NUDIX domain-containing protein [Alteribacter lacisalsi]